MAQPPSPLSNLPPQPPIPATPRFRIELEFVLSLANPAYLQHLGVTMPHLFNPSDNATTTATNPHSTTALESKTKKDNDDSEAACFARYLKYLLDYWRTPEYAQYLTHPAATIRNLELLQDEQFRRDITRPDLLVRLAEGFAGAAIYQPSDQEPQESELPEASGQNNGDSDRNEAAPSTAGNATTANVGMNGSGNTTTNPGTRPP